MRQTRPSSEFDTFLEGLATGFSESIRSGRLIPDYLQTTVHNKANTVHNIMCGIIEQAGRALGYAVERDKHRPFRDGEYFKPDFHLWKNNRLSFFVEYESTNSSDSRIIEADLGRHYFSAIKEQATAYGPMPEYWLIIYTLPDRPVEQKRWDSWDFKKSAHEYATMRLNPHRFYNGALKDPSLLCNSRRDSFGNFSTMLPQTTSGLADYDPESRTDGKLFLLNLTTDGLGIDFPKEQQRRLRF